MIIRLIRTRKLSGHISHGHDRVKNVENLRNDIWGRSYWYIILIIYLYKKDMINNPLKYQLLKEEYKVL